MKGILEVGCSTHYAHVITAITLFTLLRFSSEHWTFGDFLKESSNSVSAAII